MMTLECKHLLKLYARITMLLFWWTGCTIEVITVDTRGVVRTFVLPFWPTYLQKVKCLWKGYYTLRFRIYEDPTSTGGLGIRSVEVVDR